jgi:hypothetical protein
VCIKAATGPKPVQNWKLELEEQHKQVSSFVYEGAAISCGVVLVRKLKKAQV